MRRYASVMHDIPYVDINVHLERLFYRGQLFLQPYPDPGNSSRIILHIGQPDLPLPREFYFNQTQFQSFFDALRFGLDANCRRESNNNPRIAELT